MLCWTVTGVFWVRVSETKANQFITHSIQHPPSRPSTHPLIRAIERVMKVVKFPLAVTENPIYHNTYGVTLTLTSLLQQDNKVSAVRTAC